MWVGINRCRDTGTLMDMYVQWVDTKRRVRTITGGRAQTGRLRLTGGGGGRGGVWALTSSNGTHTWTNTWDVVFCNEVLIVSQLLLTREPYSCNVCRKFDKYKSMSKLIMNEI